MLLVHRSIQTQFDTYEPEACTFKLQSTLKHFRYGPYHCHKGPYIITWYKLQQNGISILKTGLSLQELNDFTYYMTKNGLNFSNPQYATADHEDLSENINDALPSSMFKPCHLVLRKRPELIGKLSSCMDIELINEREMSVHNYNLNFDVVGCV